VQIGAQRALIFLIAKAIEIDVLAVVVEAIGERLPEHRAKCIVETGRVTPDHVEREDALGVRVARILPVQGDEQAGTDRRDGD